MLPTTGSRMTQAISAPRSAKSSLQRGEVVVRRGEGELRDGGGHARASRAGPASPRPSRPSPGTRRRRRGSSPRTSRCRSRPVKPRARRTAAVVASVPLETSRTFSTEGSAWRMSSASSISRRDGAPKLVPPRAASTTASTVAGCGVPEDERPPRADVVDVAVAVDVGQPGALAAREEDGSPPTPRKARTGELTPPGISSRARANSWSLWVWFIAHRVCQAGGLRPALPRRPVSSVGCMATLLAWRSRPSSERGRKRSSMRGRRSSARSIRPGDCPGQRSGIRLGEFLGWLAERLELGEMGASFPHGYAVHHAHERVSGGVRPVRGDLRVRGAARLPARGLGAHAGGPRAPRRRSADMNQALDDVIAFTAVYYARTKLFHEQPMEKPRPATHH